MYSKKMERCQGVAGNCRRQQNSAVATTSNIWLPVEVQEKGKLPRCGMETPIRVWHQPNLEPRLKISNF
jgi:hypothetical protein